MTGGLRPTDSELWQGAVSGNRRSFQLLYGEVADGLYAYGCRFTQDTELVKDCIQDLFADIWKYRRSVASEVNVRVYLLVSLKRKLIAAIKRVSTPVEILDEEYAFTFDSSVEDQYIKTEQDLRIYRFLIQEIGKLPSRQKEALYLKFNQGLAYEEIAELMEVSVATARTLIYRAVKSLRQKVEKVSGASLFLWMLLHRPGATR